MFKVREENVDRVVGATSSEVTLTFDIWPWHSYSSERGTKHFFPVNLTQIRSAIPEVSIFHTQTNKNWQTAPKTEPHAVRLPVVKI